MRFISSVFVSILLVGCSESGFTAFPDEPVEPLDTSVELSEDAASELVVSPERVDFGEVELGETASAVLMLSNTGDLPLLLDGADIVADGTPFTVGPAGSLALEPGDATEVVVTYAPLVGEDHESAVRVTSDATVDPNWTVPLTGTGLRTEWLIEIQMSADDEWSGTIDGDPIGGGNQGLWTRSDVMQFPLDRGEHVIAIHAWDIARVISGFIGVVRVDGAPIAVTGGSGWTVSTVLPAPGWEVPGYDDSDWSTPGVCTDASPWDSRPTDLVNDGAQWVWTTSNCRGLGEGWFRLTFLLE